MRKPIIGITMGDPSGIGPEIVVRVLENPEVCDRCISVVIGDPKTMDQAIRVNGSSLKLIVISDVSEAPDDASSIAVLPSGELADHEVVPGTVDKRYGESAAHCCRDAVALAQDGRIDAIVSTPFNKESFHLAGITSLDDMTYFEECFGEKDTAYMIGEVAGIWVTMVTYHVGLRTVPGIITKKAVLDKIESLYDVMHAAEVDPIRIAVAGLNPHSGEGGMFGTEEIDSITPAIEDAKTQGLPAKGPVPPDSVFVNALDGQYNGVVSMYHDQANIARKILGRDQPGVTLYMGMPAPVLTVPHGTAFDIAWQGKARAHMLIKATVTAAKMALATAAKSEAGQI